MPRLLLTDEFWSKLEKILLDERIYRKRNLRLMVEGMLGQKMLNADIGIGGGPGPIPSHTTWHAGSHQAVREVEVKRGVAYLSDQSKQWWSTEPVRSNRD